MRRLSDLERQPALYAHRRSGRPAASSGKDGRFLAPALPGGPFDLTITAAGFKTATSSAAARSIFCVTPTQICARQPAPYTFGNTGRTLPDVRGPRNRNLDFSLFKNFRFGERAAALFRAEAFNLTNTVQFGLPNQGLNSPQFGVISNQANASRQLQFGLKLPF